MKTADICKNKKNETKAWFRSHLCHQVRKQIGCILQLPHGAVLTENLHSPCPLLIIVKIVAWSILSWRICYSVCW